MSNPSVDVQIACEEDDHPPPTRIRQWVAAATNEQHASAELTVRIVDVEEITQLNGDYRGKQQPTNVLSFPADLPDHIELPLLGDVVICASIVRAEAEQQHKALLDHWAHMVIHGTLHLLGYDHINDDDAERMESREIEILHSLQIANPYLIHHHAHNKTAIP